MSRRLGIAGLLALFGLAGCRHWEGPPPVDGFSLESYLGRWHEIARLPNRFERGLEAITADYARAADGSVTVTNRGWSTKKGRWKQAKGKARFVGDTTVADLEVSFFGPFYGGYRVVALDADHRWALVGSDTPRYFWLLARDPVLEPALQDSLLAQAARLGVDRSALVFVDQARNLAHPSKENAP